jgi:hypothetical protein
MTHEGNWVTLVNLQIGFTVFNIDSQILKVEALAVINPITELNRR